MKNVHSVLVICVDRDNDLGRKTGIQGPLIGKKNVLNAAAKLAVADPEESDANCMFASVKKLEEIKEEFSAVEVACLTGVDKTGTKSDIRIAEQLETVLEKFPADAFVLVTDGAEDDQVLPILQSRLPIISKQQIVIKQAREVESAFYTVQEALKDPFLARIVFGVPGIILILFFLWGSLSLQIVSFVVGIYLLLKGFGIEELFFRWFEEFRNSFSIQRISFLFVLGGLFTIIFAGITAYNSFLFNTEIDPVTNALQSLQQAYLLLFMAGEFFVIGRAIDFVQLKKAYRLPEQSVFAVSLFLLWLVLDTGTEVLLKRADIYWFLATILFSFIVLFVVFRVVRSIDIRKKITKLIVGLPVYNKEGKWIGKVQKVYREKEMIEFLDNRGKETKQLPKTAFRLQEGKIVLN